MCISLALISGKGGSGKTTIGLSISEMLASCGKKILFIDCDMSTHGATYFFEPFITDKNNYLTTIEFFTKNIDKENKKILNEKKLLNVAKNIDFIPSCIDFSKPFFEDIRMEFSKNDYEILKNEYDLIVFDCQAGYSLVTDMILDITDYNLIVMEEDAISSSSVRVLHTQLSRQLDNSKTYQVFNKLSDEDYEIYKKIVNGTIFTNLTPVMFDWSVKRAFIAHDLPEINENNPILTENIYNLTCEIFPIFKKDLDKYIMEVKRKLITWNEISIEKHKRKIRKNQLQNILTLSMLLFSMLFFIAVAIYSFYIDISFNFDQVFLVAFSLVPILVSLELFLLQSKNNKNKNKTEDIQYENQKKELKKLQNDLVVLNNKYKFSDRTINFDIFNR